MDKRIIEFNKKLRGNKGEGLQAGDVVEVHLKIKEKGKERVQIFEGLIIAIKGKQSSSPMITVRKISHGVGVEMIIPLLSKNVEKIKFIKRAKVRRSKLYYVRGLTAKQSRMKYENMSELAKGKKKKSEAKEAFSNDIVAKEEKRAKGKNKEDSQKKKEIKKIKE